MLDEYLKDLQTPVQEGVMDTPLEMLKGAYKSHRDKMWDLEDKLKTLRRWNREKGLTDRKLLDRIAKTEKKFNFERDQYDKIKDIYRNVKRDDVLAIVGDIPVLFTVLAATTALVLTFYAAHKFYKRFLTKAAKACESLGGRAKTACILGHQVRALEKAKAIVVKASASCKAAKDPSKCKEKIGKKIAKYDKKISKAKDRIKGLGG